MPRAVVTDTTDFEKLRVNKAFFVDKTDFIRQWWQESGYVATALMRPSGFGKTLTLSMLKCFFSIKYANKSSLFEDLRIWKEERVRNHRGKYPVLHLSFTNVRETSFKRARDHICRLIADLYRQNRSLLENSFLRDSERKLFMRNCDHIEPGHAAWGLERLITIMTIFTDIINRFQLVRMCH